MHNLATELIKATGLVLKEPNEFHVTHVNCSHSDNSMLPVDAAKTADRSVGDESVVLKIVLERRKIDKSRT